MSDHQNQGNYYYPQAPVYYSAPNGQGGAPGANPGGATNYPGPGYPAANYYNYGAPAGPGGGAPAYQGGYPQAPVGSGYATPYQQGGAQYLQAGSGAAGEHPPTLGLQSLETLQQLQRQPARTTTVSSIASIVTAPRRLSTLEPSPQATYVIPATAMNGASNNRVPSASRKDALTASLEAVIVEC
uniref:Uncharacterized protein n=1 Tax=Mycena chlorophos TaxID=658473 RepID=A0ABQ0LIQ3_MYCCL|nr:predicted protein [Mycena chlorophos]